MSRAQKISFQDFIHSIIDEINEQCPLEYKKSASILEGILSNPEIGKVGEKFVCQKLEKEGYKIYYPSDYGKRCLVDIFAFTGAEIWLISVKTSTDRNFPAIPDSDETRFPCAVEVLEKRLRDEGYCPCAIHLLRYQIDLLVLPSRKFQPRVNNIVDLSSK